MSEKEIRNAYKYAKEQYSRINVDTDQVIEKLSKIKISLPSWQADDIQGLLFPNQELTGGISVSGNYLGKPRNINELFLDLETALGLIPGQHRISLHSIYADTDESVDLHQLNESHFHSWVDWAKTKNIGLDFNPTLFSHPKSESGFTLSSSENEIREFWIEHVKQTRKIAAYFGEELGQVSVNNIWIPDGYKDNPVDKLSPRIRLMESLDDALTENFDDKYMLDAVEGKLFGTGVESYTVGSNDFYMAYAITRGILWTVDAGHFHPSEDVSDKLTAFKPFGKGLMLHVSRPVRWDSDHIVTLDERLIRIAETLIRDELLEVTHIGMDFFDASVNRVAALVIGTRNTLKSLLYSMLSPIPYLKDKEKEGDYTTRLAMTEELKTYPFGAVWNYYCLIHNVPAGTEWINEVRTYENKVLNKR